MYDTSRYDGGTKWNKVSRGRAGMYNAQANTIGKLLLQARRLCEAGCGYVTIHASYAGVWDMHADRNNLDMTDGMEAVGQSFDHAVAAFIRDCEQRGLSERFYSCAAVRWGVHRGLIKWRSRSLEPTGALNALWRGTGRR